MEARVKSCMYYMRNILWRTDVDKGESGGKRNVHHSTIDVC